MPTLDRYLTPSHIVTLRGRSKESAIRELAAMLFADAKGPDPSG